jgi:hypothetical protein
MKGSCSICSASPKLVAAVNSSLDRKTPLRKLSLESGFSRASLSRHDRRCRVRETLQTHRQTKFNPVNGARVIVQWPAGQLTVFTEYNHRGRPIEDRTGSPPVPIASADLREHDVLLVVQYEKAIVRNPSALLPDALAENSARDASNASDKLVN